MEHLKTTSNIQVIVPEELRPYKEAVKQFFEDVVKATKKELLKDTNTC